MASHQADKTTDEKRTPMSAREFQDLLFPHRDILQVICESSDSYFYDERLATLAAGWRQILRAEAEVEDRPKPVPPEFELPEPDQPFPDQVDLYQVEFGKPNPIRYKYDKPYPSAHFTEFFLLVDLLHHWMHHQNLYQQLQQESFFRTISPDRHDLLPRHVALVRYTIAALAMSDFGTWLEQLTKDDPDTPDDDITSFFRLDHGSGGYTLQWINRNEKYPSEPKVNLGSLFPEGRPRYFNPGMFPNRDDNEDEDGANDDEDGDNKDGDGTILLYSWCSMEDNISRDYNHFRGYQI